MRRLLTWLREALGAPCLLRFHEFRGRSIVVRRHDNVLMLMYGSYCPTCDWFTPVRIDGFRKMTRQEQFDLVAHGREPTKF